MAHQIVIAIVILICLGIALYAVDRGPFGQPIKWGIEALCCALAILGILWDFGIVA